MNERLILSISKADQMIKKSYNERRINGAIDAANKLIAEACQKEYYAANHSKSGKKYAKHRPYSVPAWCKELQKIILTRDEIAIKAAMNAARTGYHSLIDG